MTEQTPLSIVPLTPGEPAVVVPVTVAQQIGITYVRQALRSRDFSRISARDLDRAGLGLTSFP